ncbi:uncharacterized protein MELLADRAFT_93198 [Melampsora larici-populina 98AG31]|uniref:Uncharacterized protein n=1 Tax=Melampsora larici-populina (strain 98AG31 / pathotype 3-4-7) TaxID=747676 RepID=F4S461_MELLP|nr:uncharacterized protein MELLADRAFT_93198 [Melampsora larici-populina 98AG31]EGG00562.1 hypothetical protein MELLADRAFT_93198 [Melampsora larici-populina 98AG31]
MAISRRKKAQQSRRANEAERLRIDNEIVLFIENQIADSEDENECGDELNQELFPVFLTRDTSRTAIGKRKNKFGNVKNYKKPIPHPNPTIKRLISKPVPKQTEHNRRRKAHEAVGKNIGFMDNWVVKESHTITSEESVATPDANPGSNSLIELQLESDDCSDVTDHASDHTEDFPDKLETTDTIHEVDSEYNEWIASSVQQVQVNREVKQASKKVSVDQHLKSIEDEWTTLDLKIQRAKIKYKAEHSKDPKRDIPHLVLDELREFNYRRRELSLANSKSPTIQASVLAAQASLRQLPSNHMNFSSGVGRARKIRAQAKHLLDFGLVIFSQSGFGNLARSLHVGSGTTSIAQLYQSLIQVDRSHW